MPTCSEFNLFVFFDRVWEKWPNKIGEASAKKAIQVFNNCNGDLKLLEKATDLYLLDNIGTDPEFLYRFGNFIREDYWKDTLENVSEVKLNKMKAEAEMLMTSWNESCCNHWLPLIDFDTRLPTAIKALHDPCFRKGWEDALSKAIKVFKFKFRDDDPFSKIKLSFRWFTEIHHDKHTVLRILEGHYGEPVKELAEKKVIFYKKDPIALAEAAKEIAEFRLSTFGTSIQERREINKKVVEPEPEITNAAMQLVETMKRELGKKNYASKTTEVKSSVNQVLKAIGSNFSEHGEDIDEYEFVDGSGD